MHFFRDRELARRFRAGDVGEGEQMLYVLLYSLIIVIFSSEYYGYMMWNGRELTVYDHIFDLISIAFTVLTVFICYRTNSKGDNRAFVARYFSIGFPVMVQVFLMGLVLGGIIGFVSVQLMGLEPGVEETEKAMKVAGPLGLAGYTLLFTYNLVRMNGSIKIASESRRKSSSDAHLRAVKPIALFSGRFHGARRAGRQEKLPGRMAERFWQNIVNGARVAFFRPCRAEAFDTSWHALWFIFAIYVAINIGFGFFDIDPPRIFDFEGIIDDLVMLAALLLGGYLTALMFGQAERTAAPAVIMLNGLLALWLAVDVLYAFDPEWIHSNAGNKAIWAAWYIWIFMIGFRAVALAFGTESLRQLAGAGLLLAALCGPDYYFYFSDYWYKDYREQAASALDKISHEKLFAMQDDLLKEDVSALRASSPGKTDMYGVVVGSFSGQEVFRREAAFVRDTLENRYGMKGRVLTLLNNEATIEETPLAMAGNLDAALKAVGRKMQSEDILLLYMTSHGSVEEGLAVTLGYDLRFEILNGERIAEALKASGIRNKVIFVSSCFSGAMIDELQGDNTLIFTASAADRTSFGCSDELDMTYFADAYFKQALALETDLIKAFGLAQEYILKREKEEGIIENSEPQMYVGEGIAKALKAYKVPPPAKK